MNQSLQYPDNGGKYEDRAILRNAIIFTTAQRAFRAARILREPLDQLDELPRAFLAVEGFEHFVVSLEDIQGWLFVFHNWQPGIPAKSLFALLDSVRVGTAWSEDDALNLVNSLDPIRYRKFVHLPTTEELIKEGWPEETARAIDTAMPAQLAGMRKAVQRRAENERAMVRAYNKSKHMLLGTLRKHEGKLQVELLTSQNGYNDSEGIYLAGTRLGCEVADIRRRAHETIRIQAVLNSLLNSILWARYGEYHDSPGWVIDSFHADQ